MCALIKSHLDMKGAMENIGDKGKVRSFLCQTFIFSYIWGLGGNLVDSSMDKFEIFVREKFEDHPDARYSTVTIPLHQHLTMRLYQIRLPTGNDLWSLFINTVKHTMSPWTKLMPKFEYNKDVPFFELLVPTVDTVRFGYVMEKLLQVNYPVMYTGETGMSYL